MSVLGAASVERQIASLLDYIDTLASGPALETGDNLAAVLHGILSQLRRLIHGATPDVAERWYDAVTLGVNQISALLTELELIQFVSLPAAQDLERGQVVYTTAANLFNLGDSTGYPQARITGIVHEGASAGFTARVMGEGMLALDDWSNVTDDSSVSLVPNARYYLSATPGKIAQMGASVGVLVQLGRAITSKVLHFHINATILRG